MLKKDGKCWGFYWAWWCLSWGTGGACAPASANKVSESALACDTVRYCVQKGVYLSFDALGLPFDNPIQLWTVGVKYLSTSVIAKLSMLWKVAGLIITFLFLLLLEFTYLSVPEVVIRF